MRWVRLVACTMASAALVSGCGSTGSQETVSPSQGPTAVASSEDPLALMQRQLDTAMAGLSQAQLDRLCEGFATDPDGVAEAFARPLDLAGVSRADSMTAITAALKEKCG